MNSGPNLTSILALLILPICALLLCYGLKLGLSKFLRGWREGRRKRAREDAFRQRKPWIPD